LGLCPITTTWTRIIPQLIPGRDREGCDVRPQDMALFHGALKERREYQSGKGKDMRGTGRGCLSWPQLTHRKLAALLILKVSDYVVKLALLL